MANCWKKSYFVKLLAVVFFLSDGMNAVVHFSNQHDQFPEFGKPVALRNDDVVSMTMSEHVVDKFSLASYYEDHMVLQSAPREARVWGYAPKSTVGKTVSITLSSSGSGNAPYTANYTAKVILMPTPGFVAWQIQMKPVPVGGPYTFKASLGDDSLQISDVLFGDVWLCSGQSNMEFPVSNMFNATEELENAHLHTDVRIFDVAMIFSPKPLYDLPGIARNWALPSKESINSFSAVCWLFGRYINKLTNRPQGMVETCWGGTRVEAWSSQEALRQCGIPPDQDSDSGENFNDQNTQSVLWNAMVYPLLPMTIYGAIWYQGEANVHAPDTYNCTFPMMISDWRKRFHIATDGQTSPLFPFGFVQLAPSGNDGWTLTSGTTDIRWHQTADDGYVPNEKMPNVFMAVTMDLPDPNSPYSGIHPRDKITVGERLSLAGWAVAYGKRDIIYQGPFPGTMTFRNTSIDVLYDKSIEIRENDGFEVCCDPAGCKMSGTNWTPTVIKNSDRRSVTVALDNCHGHLVTGIRYSWRENPCQYKKCAVYHPDTGLPAPAFIHWTHF